MNSLGCRSRRTSIALAIAVSIVIASTVWAAGTVRRARPPKSEPSDAFFADARQELVGPRPTASANAGNASGDNGSAKGGSAEKGFAWSQLISSDTLESEVKSIVRQLGETMKNPSAFRGGKYQDARREFSVLAVMFAIIAGYDGEVRWQRSAGAIRPLVSRAGFNCKVGTDLSYREAKQRQEDLDKLLRGEAPPESSEDEKATWDKVSSRSPLMQRLERAERQGLVLWTSDASQFQKNNAQFTHEAELIAAMAEVISREGFEFADDDTYLGYAHAMRDAANEAADAARKKNYEQARKAVSVIEKNCNSCHEGYRS
jgi:Cytochrome C'